MYCLDIHADDYGLTEKTTLSILDGINAGKLDSTSVMPNMKYFNEAALLWKTKREYDRETKVSVHLNFMEGYCVAPRESLPHLVDGKGLFSISWGTLVKYNYHPVLRTTVKNELKIEIKHQILRVKENYSLPWQKGLRIDSHQHSHMIPLIMEALVEVLQEEQWNVEYIRISKEQILPYFRFVTLWKKHELLNFIKVAVLNYFSFKDKAILRAVKIPDMYLSGVFFSGMMSIERVNRIFPYLKKKAQKKDCGLEILFHPGQLDISELTEEFNHPSANKFYVSQGRQIEYEAMMGLQLHNVI